ncbi:uncharacterized protein LOC114401927 [Glycine soja]|uniref:uncharacterized protein LOC114401927 n=1 Tax=Glycine soja TaxID=3848 RepID=UPI00103D6DA7|nr:uncharacterized protein LOC114401927 [Glycine soja]
MTMNLHAALNHHYVVPLLYNYRLGVVDAADAKGVATDGSEGSPAADGSEGVAIDGSEGSPTADGSEGVTTDGSEGSPVVDEEFPGGPCDPSILTGFSKHLTHSIWSGKERPELKVVSHCRKVYKFGRPAPEIESMIAATGLSPLIRCSVITTNPGLIFAFVERWHGKTSTFHLPVGELTITLDDVSSVLHLPITDALHTFEPLVTFDVVMLLTELLKCWIYEHFPMVHQCVVDDAYAEASPRASRWLTSKAHMRGIKGAPYQARIEALTVMDVCWMPYAKHQGVKGFDLISSYTGQLRWGQIVVYVRPEWVLRQFGYIQTVPPPPIRDSLTGLDIDGRWLHFSDHLVPAGEICVVPGQVALDYMDWFFQISHPFVTPIEDGAELRHLPTPHDEEFVEPPIPEVPVASDLPTHLMVDCQGCQAIAEDLERVVNLRMVTEGTELYDIMARCLRIARGDDAADGSLRLRQRWCIE